MQNEPVAGKAMTPDQREQLEADYTFKRVVELELEPVRGNFDAAHLKEINRRIFQDLPGEGFNDVEPGDFRPPVPEGKDWMKNRGLSTVEGTFYVAYSRMDEAAKARERTAKTERHAAQPEPPEHGPEHERQCISLAGARGSIAPSA